MGFSLPEKRRPSALGLLLLLFFLRDAKGDTPQAVTGPASLKNLSLEELSQIDVTTPTKLPRRFFKARQPFMSLRGMI
jgi:hypothetical protein